MKPGRELDAIIAEKVLGFINVRDDIIQTDKDYRGHWERELIHQPCAYAEGYLEIVPYFSTDIAAAWRIIDKLAPLVGDFEQADGYFKLMYADSAGHGGPKKCDPGESRYDADDTDLTRWSAHFHPGMPGADTESAKLFPMDSGWSCARGETAAHAICLAALKIVSEKVTEVAA